MNIPRDIMMDYSTLSDNGLAERLAFGEEPAFNEIYERYWSGVFLVARNRLNDDVEAEEVVQEIFCKLWRRRADFQLEKTFRSYFAVAVKYEIINRSAKKRRETDFADQLFRTNRDIDDSTLQLLSFNELKKALEESICLLPDRCQLVFRLRLEKDYSQKQIAKELDISEKTVETHLAKARKHIRASLGSTLPFHLVLLVSMLAN